jgi:hypothetical protein
MVRLCEGLAAAVRMPALGAGLEPEHNGREHRRWVQWRAYHEQRSAGEQAVPICAMELFGLRASDPRGAIGLVVLASELTPPPPYFVHVLVYGTTDVSALGFALPRGPPRPLTDALLQRTNGRRAILISRVQWAGHPGELILAPSFPGGGEMGSHLIFSYRTGRIYRGISLHPWPSVYRFRIDFNRVNRAVKLAPGPAYPEIETTLRRIVESSG